MIIIGLRFKYLNDGHKIIYIGYENNKRIEYCNEDNTIEFSNFGYTWISKHEINVDINNPDITKLSLSNFRKTCRHKNKKPVWILRGNYTHLLDHLHQDNLKGQLLFDNIPSDNNNEYITITVASSKTSMLNHQTNNYVFIGGSNLGKTYISQHISGLSVFETDNANDIDNSNWHGHDHDHDIIVLGNKYDANEFNTELNNRIIVRFEKH